MDISIKKAILHILDSSSNMPVISRRELELEGSGISDFISAHITKIDNDTGAKKAEFIQDDDNVMRNAMLYLAENIEEFVSISAGISEHLFELMIKHIDIPAADMLICLFDMHDRRYLGILKLNYRQCYTHFVYGDETEEGGGVLNQLILHRAILPSETHRIEEAALICLEDLSIRLLEGVYEVDGQKTAYFSQLFLRCTTQISKKETLNVIQKKARDLTEKYFDGSFEKVTEVKNAICELTEKEGMIQVEKLAQRVFADSQEVQQEYVEKLEKAGVAPVVSLDESYVEKKVSTQKIKTDTGIEIHFPASIYKNKEKMEFINNPDGTISILIKNVTRITGR